MLIEIQQMITYGAKYWKDMYNYGNISLILIDLFVVIEHSTKIFNITQESLVYTALIAQIQLWFMFYYWWRLNNNTAFYVKMLT